MTPKRAQEIIDQARAKAVCGPWSDQIDHVMRPGEHEEVCAVWDTMPGNTCFVDALYRIRDGKADDIKAVGYTSTLYDRDGAGRQGPMVWLTIADVADQKSLSKAMRAGRILPEASAHVKSFSVTGPEILGPEIRIVPAWEVNQPYPLSAVTLTRVAS